MKINLTCNDLVLFAENVFFKTYENLTVQEWFFNNATELLSVVLGIDYSNLADINFEQLCYHYYDIYQDTNQNIYWQGIYFTLFIQEYIKNIKVEVTYTITLNKG